MAGARLCAGALLTTLVLAVVLLRREQQALRAPPGRILAEEGRALGLGKRPPPARGTAHGGKCKGQPDPQQQLNGLILDTICERIGKPGANFLVFGLGRDSPFWYSNTGGKITFLENHEDWVKFQSEEIKKSMHIVQYTTEISRYKTILHDKAKLREFFDKLPQDVRDTRWDVILVDSPMGHVRRGVPGRMQSMYAARELAHGGTTIFVDDYQRIVETESAAILLAPVAETSVVFDNGHDGKTAMFVMPAGGPGSYEPAPLPAEGGFVSPREVPEQSFTSKQSASTGAALTESASTGASSTVCKGTPAANQQLAGKILEAICERIGKSGANFLVFGLGRDSPFWFSNTGGKITFLENHPEWTKFQTDEIRKVTHIVKYTTRITQYKEILQDEAQLKPLLDSLPAAVRETRWDVILVDSPMGQKMTGKLPGRMQSIYAARKLAHPGTVVFVDDYERKVESESSAALLVPFSESSSVYSNGHGGKTAMFVMATGGAER